MFVGYDFIMGCLCKWFVRYIYKIMFDRVEIWKIKFFVDFLVCMKLFILKVNIVVCLKLIKNN